uniref:3'-5' exonuclease domain-containing protein n=1 Tax=Strongyloides papillosus TaxID=174720 RepID=A0A0N5BHM2_STREA
MIDAYVNLGIDVRKVSQMVVSGVGKKNVVAVANLLICYIVTQKAVAVDVYFINDMTPLITVQTAHALGLSIDELTSQAINKKIKLIQVLDDLNKSTFDESLVKPLCTRKYDEKSRYAAVYDMDYFANLANQGWDKLWLSKEGKKNSRNRVPARIKQLKSPVRASHLLAKCEPINELLESIKKYNDPDELFPTSEKVPPLQLNLPAPE